MCMHPYMPSHMHLYLIIHNVSKTCGSSAKLQDPLVMLRCAQATPTLISILKHPKNLGESLNTFHSLYKPNLDAESPLKMHQESSGHPRTLTLALEPFWLVQVMVYHGSWPCHQGPLNSKVCSRLKPLKHLNMTLASPNPNLSNHGSWWNLWLKKP